MRSFHSPDFTSPLTQKPHPGTYLRPAVVMATNAAKGTVNIEWLDHPGVRQDVLLCPPGQGIFELPTIGSAVLVGFGIGFDAYILAYIPVGYRDLVGTPRGLDDQVAPSILKLSVGEKMFFSYLEKSEENQGNQYAQPSPTGTYMHMSNVGDVLIKTAEGDYWRLDRRSNIIQQNSMNYRAITEAGILDFGLVKRSTKSAASADKQTEDIISTEGSPLGVGVAGAKDEDALTEFRLRILEKADANSLTEPEVADPLVELTLGTRVTDDGIVTKTDNTYAKTSDDKPKEIMIQLKTKADQGFEFVVDKEGNLTVKVNGNVKVNVEGDSNIRVNGDADIHVIDDVRVNATNMTFTAEDIKVAGNAKEQPVVLEQFLKTFYNTHTHIGNMGAPTGPPIVPSPLTPGRDISKITKAG